MTPPTDARDAERFRAAIAGRLGLRFEDAKLEFLGEVLQRRLETLKQSCDTYLRRLEDGSTSDDIGMLARDLTVGETYFFRNNDQFRALAEIVLPERLRAQATSKAVRLLSAGCASGEEAYSIAMVARETIPDPAWNVSIRAVDINPAMLEKAARARFSTWALRETPPDILGKWFRPEGRDMILEETVRAAVRFEERNLSTDDPELWQPAAYDVIFCRNVVMYFSPDQARALMARITRSLAPGGYLFLGHAETLRGLADGFHLRHTHGTFYYERKENIGHPVASPGQVHPQFIPPASVATFTDAWVDAIREASERIEALVPARVAARPPDVPARPARPARDMAGALDLLRNERFAEALAYLRDLPTGSGRDPDVLLLEAMLLAHSGDLVAAEDTCGRLLMVDELNAGAHYVLALCRENSADRAGAAEHDRVAVYLDPTFAMPRLHLGLLARHAGDRDTARRELEQALLLLRSEDPSRLLLFGGGFNREALIVLCRSALRDCGGQP